MSLEPCLTMLGKMCVGEPTAKGVTYWIVNMNGGGRGRTLLYAVLHA